MRTERRIHLRNWIAGASFALAVMGAAQAVSAQGSSGRMVKGPVVIDLLEGLEWMRCSVGQVWSSGTCRGTVLKAPLAAADDVILRASRSSGEGWRLPTRKELTRLAEMNDTPPMINTTQFPGTYRGSYWTSDRNRLLRRNHWVVNFNTGHAYARALPRQMLVFRLVRDRQN